MAEVFHEKSDFQTEAHEITTEDGYILTLLRISKRSSSVPSENEKNFDSPEDNNGFSKKTPAPVALFVHGFVCSAEHWCLNSPDKVLPYRLANQGYDCWLANLRGTPLSRRHVSIPKGSKSYWNFSFHDIAIQDIPEMINYILEVTGNSSLSYISHSMGCTVLLIALSLKPEFISKVKVFVALAPAVYGAHIRNKFFKPLIPIGNLIGKSKFIRNRALFGKPAIEYAKRVSPQSQRHRLANWLIKGLGSHYGIFGKTQIEKERVPLVAKAFPSPTSLKLFSHGVQCWYSGKLRQYNYGRSTNLKIYGQEKPPAYDFSTVKVPTAIFYSEYDELCRPADVLHLSEDLPNVIANYYVTHSDFSHIDFLFGKDVNELVYDKAFEILLKFKES